LEAVKAEAAAREAKLQKDLLHERQLYEETFRLFHAQQMERGQEVGEVEQEVKALSTDLEQKEEEILSIQFDMVELQNKLQDQVRLVGENAEAYQHATEELADKDQKLESAVQRQEELLSQMNDVSGQLKEKISRLSQELEGSRASYQALEEQTRSAVARLEAERDALGEELARVRAERDAEKTALHTELESRDAAAAERCAALESALRTAQESTQQATRDLEDKTSAESAALARAIAAEAALSVASQREAGLLDELRAEQAKVSAQVEELRLQKQAAEAAACVQQLEASELENHRKELASLEAARAEAVRKTWSLQERLSVATEKLAGKEAELHEQATALERSRLLERQARERAQEYRTALELHREFGSEGFLTASPKSGANDSFPTGAADTGARTGTTTVAAALDRLSSVDETAGEDGEVKLPEVLISVELDIGSRAGSATLSIAPWQTRSDYESVVQEFLQRHRIKAVFADALVAYLEEVEAQAPSFPAMVKADLPDLYSRYG
jgi:hypothetical protein